MTAQSTPVNITGLTQAISAVPCTYRGLHVFSTPGATVTVYDNTAASGTVLAKFTLAAAGDKVVDLADGTRCATGVYLSSTAAVEGHVRIG
jgi:hypothetical protein